MQGIFRLKLLTQKKLVSALTRMKRRSFSDLFKRRQLPSSLLLVILFGECAHSWFVMDSNHYRKGLTHGILYLLAQM